MIQYIVHYIQGPKSKDLKKFAAVMPIQVVKNYKFEQNFPKVGNTEYSKRKHDLLSCHYNVGRLAMNKRRAQDDPFGSDNNRTLDNHDPYPLVTSSNL